MCLNSKYVSCRMGCRQMNTSTQEAGSDEGTRFPDDGGRVMDPKLAILLKHLQRAAAERFTGRLLITMDFNGGGTRRMRVDQLTKLNDNKED